MLRHAGLAGLSHVSVTLNGSLPSQDLALLRAWTVCPGLVLEVGTRRVVEHLALGKMLEKNNEVAVQWMLAKALDRLLFEHPTSLHEDRQVLQDKQMREHQPDMVSAVAYTAWVKSTAHRGILRALATVERIYRGAAHAWLDSDHAAEHLHRANVEVYLNWAKQMDAWRRSWRTWWNATDLGDDS